MGARGPAPKPDWLRVLEGNPGKRPLKKAKKREKTKQAPPRCPDWIGKEAKAEWRRLAPELERRGLLTSLDVAAFACYCQAWSQYAAAEAVLNERGLTYMATNGRVVERPEVAISASALKLVLSFGREFGLTPAGRARLNLPPQLSDEDDEFDRWLDGR